MVPRRQSQSVGGCGGGAEDRGWRFEDGAAAAAACSCRLSSIFDPQSSIPQAAGAALLRKEFPDRVHRLLTLDRGDGLQQGDVLRADLDAVAGLAAVAHAALLHQ